MVNDGSRNILSLARLPIPPHPHGTRPRPDHSPASREVNTAERALHGIACERTLGLLNTARHCRGPCVC